MALAGTNGGTGAQPAVEGEHPSAAPVDLPSASADDLPPWLKPERIIRPLYQDSGLAFRDMEVLDDDVVLSSYPKAGTTWIHNIVYSLLRTGRDGEFLQDLDSDIGANSQIYPDAVPLERPEAARKRFGFASFRALLEQPSPRLFSTHMREGMLPTQLRERGKLVYMMRNPKDTVTSLHFFLKKVAELSPKELAKTLAREDWLGDGSGTTGTYHRFNAWPEEQNEHWCGSYYGHVLGMDALIRSLGTRATVVYYERLQEDLTAELWRLGNFLGVPMSDSKVSIIRERVSLESMSSRLKDEGKGALVRKGVVGDHMQHLTPRHWKQMDEWFAERLKGVSIAEPLLVYMGGEQEEGEAA